MNTSYITHCFTIVVGALLLLGQVQPAFVDPGVVFSNWIGWGSSLAWFGDVLGGLDQNVQNEINAALFSVIFLYT